MVFLNVVSAWSFIIIPRATRMLPCNIPTRLRRSMYNFSCAWALDKLSGLSRLFSSKADDKLFTVCVEGNIGSGKTTLLEYFNELPNTQVLQEPVKSWRDVKGHNLLGLLYSDPTRWSLTFQTYVQLTMLDLHTCRQTHPVKMMERSIFSARYCFVENLYKSKLMPAAEYIVLNEWFEWLTIKHTMPVDLIVYLQTRPETVYKRIKARCRKEEATIPLEYLESLHELHEDWLVRQTKFQLPAPVLILDANQELPEMKEQFRKHQSKILFNHL